MNNKSVHQVGLIYKISHLYSRTLLIIVLCLYFRIEPQPSKLQELDNDELTALKKKETEVN